MIKIGALKDVEKSVTLVILSDSLGALCVHTVLQLQPPTIFKFYKSETLSSLDSNDLFSYPPRPWPRQPNPTLCTYGFDYYRYLIRLELYAFLWFCVWFISLGLMTSKFIHIVVYARNFVPFKAWNISLFACTTFCLSVYGHLGWLSE